MNGASSVRMHDLSAYLYARPKLTVTPNERRPMGRPAIPAPDRVAEGKHRSGERRPAKSVYDEQRHHCASDLWHQGGRLEQCGPGHSDQRQGRTSHR